MYLSCSPYILLPVFSLCVFFNTVFHCLYDFMTNFLAQQPHGPTDGIVTNLTNIPVSDLYGLVILCFGYLAI